MSLVTRFSSGFFSNYGKSPSDSKVYQTYFNTGPIGQISTKTSGLYKGDRTTVRSQMHNVIFIKGLIQQLIQLFIFVKKTEIEMTVFELTVMNNIYLLIGVDAVGMIYKQKQLHVPFQQMDDVFPYLILLKSLEAMPQTMNVTNSLFDKNFRSFASFLNVLQVVILDPVIWGPDLQLSRKLQFMEQKLLQEEEKAKILQQDLIIKKKSNLKLQHVANQSDIMLRDSFRTIETYKKQAAQYKVSITKKTGAHVQKLNLQIKNLQLLNASQKADYESKLAEEQEKIIQQKKYSGQYLEQISELIKARQQKQNYFQNYVHHKNQQNIFYQNYVSKLTKMASNLLGKLQFFANKSKIEPSLLGNIVSNEHLIQKASQLGKQVVDQIQSNLGQLNVEVPQTNQFNLSQHHGKSQQFYKNMETKADQHLQTLQKIDEQIGKVMVELAKFQANPSPFVHPTEQKVIETMQVLEQQVKVLVKTQAESAMNSSAQTAQHAADSNIIEKVIDPSIDKLKDWQKIAGQQIENPWKEVKMGDYTELSVSPESLKQQTILIPHQPTYNRAETKRMQAEQEKVQRYRRLKESTTRSYFS